MSRSSTQRWRLGRLRLTAGTEGQSKHSPRRPVQRASGMSDPAPCPIGEAQRSDEGEGRHRT
eukprot:3827789-Pleurochrysis_carterae.AAC.1